MASKVNVCNKQAFPRALLKEGEKSKCILLSWFSAQPQEGLLAKLSQSIRSYVPECCQPTSHLFSSWQECDNKKNNSSSLFWWQVVFRLRSSVQTLPTDSQLELIWLIQKEGEQAGSHSYHPSPSHIRSPNKQTIRDQQPRPESHHPLPRISISRKT